MSKGTKVFLVIFLVMMVTLFVVLFMGLGDKVIAPRSPL